MKYKCGIDIGSTTAKIAVFNDKNELIFKEYKRHNTEVYKTLVEILKTMEVQWPDIDFHMGITGTAGMGVSEKAGVPFIQEVVASAEIVKILYPEVRTLIDLGGEDAKIIFFNEDLKPDIRMNGNCAGGTGAFIDQMATLLGVKVEEVNGLAANSENVYPIASRCGVFAKTDVQNLISRDIPAADIAASIYRAVSFQAINTLARGSDIHGKVLFAGGPLSFQPELKKAFIGILDLKEDDVFTPDYPELLPAMGCALAEAKSEMLIKLSEFIQRVEEAASVKGEVTGRLKPLFAEGEYEGWKKEKEQYRIASDFESTDEEGYFLGIDSGSTTTKIVLLNHKKELAARYYSNNNGNPIEAVLKGLTSIKQEFAEKGRKLNILRSAVTGYGEDLIQFAFKLDEGHVETIAHYQAARFFDPEVSFILDIGGQDMKAIYIRDGVINNLELNEACSSGCGSFIETFAASLGYGVVDFAAAACTSSAPCDLGTRCTVFMNSKVKQSLREGAVVGDISAGLAYSVIKNCFNKVLKITDDSLIGDHIVVQGGTFKNHAVLKAVETVLEKKVVRPDIPELMGAFGAALIALDAWSENTSETRFIGFDNLEKASDYEKKQIVCKGCENNCRVSRLSFSDSPGEYFYTGNKCEKIFSNRLKGGRQGRNLHELKRKLLFSRKGKPVGKPKMKIGIPRVLNMWDDFPFWNTLFTGCGFEVQISDPSSVALAEKGYGTVMSENICFPAKIANGHVVDLIEKGVDRIFYPMVRYSRSEYDTAVNKYNCPVVTGYPQVIESSVNPEKKYGIPFDNPPLSFASEGLLEKACWQYVSQFSVDRKSFKVAFQKALEEEASYRKDIIDEAALILKSAEAEGRRVIMLIGRPYHVDALVNHKISEMISALGVDLITEDSIPVSERSGLDEVNVLTQWLFPNRIYDAAIWAGEQKNVDVVQLNSFGCGPDAIAVDEVKPILNQYGKNPTVIRIDEITSPGSVKLRIRSMIESLKMKDHEAESHRIPRVTTKVFKDEDKRRKIIAPVFSPFYTEFLIASFKNTEYEVEILPMPDRESTELGLKYANNDICYPATIVIGDLIKALQSGKYNPDEIAVALTQTGGQCRASSYISLLKKAMVNAGFKDVPVVAISAQGNANPINEQPGFIIPKSFSLDVFFGLIYADVLARWFYSHAPREKDKGASQAIVNKYIELGKEVIDYKSSGKMFALLEQALIEFNALDADLTPLPKVGIVGEIYVKFNPYSNGYLTDWLIENKVEPEVPPLANFFLTMFVTEQFNKDNHIEDKNNFWLTALRAGEKIVDHFIHKANRIIKKSRVITPGIHTIRDLSENAQEILSLINQYGESWLLAGDIVGFLKDGITEVVCLQPFGCIANHVIAKGMEKKMKDLYPHLNLLFLDMDSGASEVNMTNRLEFLIRGARESLKA